MPQPNRPLRRAGAAALGPLPALLGSLLAPLLALLLGLAPALLAPTPAAAQIVLDTPDGRRVRLKPDHTWEYVDEPAAGEDAQGREPEGHLLLELARRYEKFGECRFGVRLTNHLGVEVRSIVPTFSAYTRGGVLYETVNRGFLAVKPTRDQYREIAFSGIACADIARVVVGGGDRCEMGELNKFTPVTGECLRRIRVAPSDLVEFTK